MLHNIRRVQRAISLLSPQITLEADINDYIDGAIILLFENHSLVDGERVQSSVD